MRNIYLLLSSALLLHSCSSGNGEYDASGTFEADEIVISSEVTGIVKDLRIEEGQEIKGGFVVAHIDTIQLSLKKKQVQAQISAVLSKRPDVAVQLTALQEQLQHAVDEQKRIEALYKAEAATKKQLDDANAQVKIIRSQLDAQRSSLKITSASLNEEIGPLMAQLEQLNDQLKRSEIINPVAGTVLVRYVNVNEMAAAGKPIYKIADMSSMLLRAYFTGNSYSALKNGQKVHVFINAADGGQKQYEGTVEWISSKAEFTPKTIQTKDERQNLVYAAKIRVRNDGMLKIGMYGDVKL